MTAVIFNPQADPAGSASASASGSSFIEALGSGRHPLSDDPCAPFYLNLNPHGAPAREVMKRLSGTLGLDIVLNDGGKYVKCLGKMDAPGPPPASGRDP